MDATLPAGPDGTLQRLRLAYRGWGLVDPWDAQGNALLKPEELRRALADAKAQSGRLTPAEREELDLLDAKVSLRLKSIDDAQRKLMAFLKMPGRSARYASEARGWLAHTYYVQRDLTTAGKMYIDELNRTDSTLPQNVILDSLAVVYDSTGSPELIRNLEKYFDTPEHAAFAVQMVTKPRRRWDGEDQEDAADKVPHARIRTLLRTKGAALLRSQRGASSFGLISMCAALRAGDPAMVIQVASNIPANAALRSEPDFLWMFASAQYLTKNYEAAEEPLLALYNSRRALPVQKVSAAHGLCGVYFKTGNRTEQLRYALWLREAARYDSGIYTDRQYDWMAATYWAESGLDSSLLLDGEAPDEALREFLEKYPKAAGADLARYSLAVRLARQERYEESATLFESIGAKLRTRRMREMSALAQKASESASGKFSMAQYLSQNQERIYFNDRLWNGLQTYALVAQEDVSLTKPEREQLLTTERKLRDDQEEYWRAYQILHELVRTEGHTPLGRQSAALAIRCLRKISGRFGREKEIAAADIELSKWLKRRS
jgi:hypothetical protein